MSRFTKGVHHFENQAESNGFGRLVGRVTLAGAMQQAAAKVSKKPVWQWNSGDINSFGQFVDPFRANSQEKASTNEATALDEQNAQNQGLSQQQLLLNNIDRAYGIDTNTAPLEEQIQGYIGQLNGRLGKTAFDTFGDERASAQKNRASLTQLLSQVQAASAGGNGQAANARNAIDMLSARSATGAKRDATRELDSRLAQTLTQQRAAAYTRGVAGSSFDNAARANAIAGYTTGRASIGNTLTQSDQAFRDSLDQQRRSLEDRARAGADSSFDTAAALSDQQSAASQAYSGLTDRSIGKLLATGSDVALDSTVQRSVGNAGLGAYGPYGQGMVNPFRSSRPTGGTITRG